MASACCQSPVGGCPETCPCPSMIVHRTWDNTWRPPPSRMPGQLCPAPWKFPPVCDPLPPWIVPVEPSACCPMRPNQEIICPQPDPSCGPPPMVLGFKVPCPTRECPPVPCPSWTWDPWGWDKGRVVLRPNPRCCTQTPTCYSINCL